MAALNDLLKSLARNIQRIDTMLQLLDELHESGGIGYSSSQDIKEALRIEGNRLHEEWNEQMEIIEERVR